MSESSSKLVRRALTTAFALVVVIGFVLGDPTPKDRALALGHRIMCPVCQGESIAISPSETAKAMMQVVEEKVRAGETDDQIIAYFVASYGDAILLDPPLSGKTLAVWLLPIPAIAAGVWMALSRRRNRVRLRAMRSGQAVASKAVGR